MNEVGAMGGRGGGEGPASYMNLSSKHIVPYILKHVSGIHFMPSTECGSGKGHKGKGGYSVCMREKAKPALN